MGPKMATGAWGIGDREREELGLLIDSEVSELYRKLRETCRKKSVHISSTSELMVPIYEVQNKSVHVKGLYKHFKA